VRIKTTPEQSILVVDDDTNLRKTLADILKVKCYESVVAANGAEAIAAAEKRPFSLALIDLMLPDMAGLEVMARIKTISPLTEAIILTGHASLDTAIEATRQGAYAYLLKPYQMEELLRLIGHGVEHQQAQEEILRLASFPRLDPSPVIELDATGNVTYLNPAAEREFPDLGEKGQAHPLLLSSADMIAKLRQGKWQGDAIHDSRLGEATYELHISYVREVDLVRVYVLDITRRKLAEDELHLLATTDSLTGIANRREFYTILAREVGLAKRYGTPVSLAMYDLDYFKLVNDTFGHDAGDYVLQAVTSLVKENIRAPDFVARWGGEEFMLLMPQLDMGAASNVAERLRLAIAEHDFDKVGKLTVSFGVTAFESEDDKNSLLMRVDDALYRAKEHGRNRVEALDSKGACQ
jgi:diguanylate cyclase (GGDEF)-like protein